MLTCSLLDKYVDGGEGGGQHKGGNLSHRASQSALSQPVMNSGMVVICGELLHSAKEHGDCVGCHELENGRQGGAHLMDIGV